MVHLIEAEDDLASRIHECVFAGGLRRTIRLPRTRLGLADREEREFEGLTKEAGADYHVVRSADDLIGLSGSRLAGRGESETLCHGLALAYAYKRHRTRMNMTWLYRNAAS
jgi:hypothetical protein